MKTVKVIYDFAGYYGKPEITLSAPTNATDQEIRVLASKKMKTLMGRWTAACPELFRIVSQN